MLDALNNYVIRGVTHNVPLCYEVLTHPYFIKGRLSAEMIGNAFYSDL